MFREHYPKVKLQVGSILSLDGEQERIVTAGSVASWQELAIYLITRLCGPRHALGTAKVHLLCDHSDGQLPYAVMTPRVQQSDAVIGDCQVWIAENYMRPNPVAGMANRTAAPRPVSWTDSRLPGTGPIGTCFASITPR